MKGLLENDSVRLPTLPLVTDRIRKALAQEEASFDTIAGELGADAALAANIVKAANSVFYAGKQPVKNVKDAVSRIGLSAACNIAQAVMAKGMFVVENRRLLDLTAQLWRHAISCALINDALAARFGLPRKEDYFTLGLLHDLGKIVIVHLLAQGERRGHWDTALFGEENVRQLFAMAHARFGVSLVQKWRYPDPFPEVVGKHHNIEAILKEGREVQVTALANFLTRELGFTPRQDTQQEIGPDVARQILDLGEGGYNEIREATRQRMQGLETL